MASLSAESDLRPLVARLRAQFPALSRIDPQSQLPIVYLDGPAGSQVPEAVIQAIADYYRLHNANTGGMFASSQETQQLMAEAHQAAADWFGGDDPRECFFGANMTSLTFAFSRALARQWPAGSRVVVTQLDHDANVTPWRMAAAEVGASVETVRVNPDDATLDEEDFQRRLVEGTRLVAFTAASNSVGSITPIQRLAEMAHRVGAEVYVDAVHWAPHRLIDVADWNVDYCVCSAYKFFGPHVGLFWGRRERLEALSAYKVRPAPAQSPGKWMTGTPNFAAIQGVRAAIDYVASIANWPNGPGESDRSRRQSLRQAFEAIEAYETALVRRLIEGLRALPHVRLFGITDSSRLHQRVPTVVLTIDGLSSAEAAGRLAREGIFCWHGDYYAVDLCAALGQAEQGMVRLGIVHTTTQAEIDRTIAAVSQLAP